MSLEIIPDLISNSWKIEVDVMSSDEKAFGEPKNLRA